MRLINTIVLVGFRVLVVDVTTISLRTIPGVVPAHLHTGCRQTVHVGRMFVLGIRHTPHCDHSKVRRVGRLGVWNLGSC